MNQKIIAKYVRKGGTQYWVIECPHCGRRHWLKAGDYTKDPMESLGLRETLCGELVILESQCRVCGCTDALPCPGGCHWVKPNLCGRCADIILNRRYPGHKKQQNPLPATGGGGVAG
jgi:hypothetical protein